MKKTRLLGLGVCALALGAVAGVVSTQRALEARADEPTKAATLYLKAGVWKTADPAPDFYAYTWNGESDNPNWTKGAPVAGTSDVYSFTLPAIAPDKVIFTRNDPGKAAGWEGKWNQTADLNVPNSNGKTYYKISDWGGETSPGEWLDYADVDDGAYLVGDHNTWTINADSKGTASATNLGEWEGVALTATQKFKIILAESKSTAWYGGEFLGDDSTKALVDVDGEGNIKPKADGTYNLYFANDKKIYITKDSVSTKEYHVLGLDGWADADSNKMEAATEEGYIAKKVVTIKSGDKFKIHESSENAWYGANEGILTSAANAAKFSPDEDGNIVVGSAVPSATQFTIYLSNAHKVGIVGPGETVADLVEPTPLADGYYLIGVGGSWNKSTAIPSDEIVSPSTDKFVKVGLNIEHGEEFKIVKIESEEFVWTDIFAADPNKSEEPNDCSANFLTSNDHNGGVNIKAIASGTFDIYVNASGEIYVFGDAEERTATKEVDEFIDDFITPNVTDPDGEGKYQAWESCADKFTTAKKALERLSDTAQSLFLEDAGASAKIKAARAAYTWWRDHKSAGEEARFIAPLSSKETTIISVGGIIAIGAIVAGAMIYFSKKRKASK